MTEPLNQDPDYRRHRAACAACAAWSAEIERLERRLQQAAHLPVPPGTAEGILLRHAFRAERAGPGRWRRAMPLAASFVLGLAVGIGVLSVGLRPTLAGDVLDHIDELVYVLENDGTLEDEAVASVLGWIGLNVEDDVGDARFANLCTLRGTRVAHLVVAGRNGPVTIMIMPTESIARSVRVGTGDRGGIIVPFGPGALAIVSERAERIDQIEDRVRKSLRWVETAARGSGTDPTPSAHPWRRRSAMGDSFSVAGVAPRRPV